jgi:hypothetical protein
MDAREHTVLIFPTRRICGLEWIAWAMDAARQYCDSHEKEPFCDTVTFYYSEHLTAL